MNNDITSESMAKDIAKRLIDSDVYSINFTKDKTDWIRLPDGTITPCYCNCRYVNKFPDQTRIIVNYLEFLIRLKFKDAEIIVGLATAGIPIASLLADRLNLPNVLYSQ